MNRPSFSPTKTWEFAGVPNLYRNAKSVYYARYRVGRQDVWQSLRTTVKSVAVNDLDKVMDSVSVLRSSGLAPVTGPMRFRDAQKLYLENFLADETPAENTKRLRLTGIKLLNKSWPQLESMSVRKLKAEAIRAWFERLKAEAEPYVPKGAKRAVERSDGKSATTMNGALDSLRLILDVAVVKGYLPTNPARHQLVKRVIPPKTELNLPSPEEFLTLVETIRNSGVQHCYDAADMVTFLALTGARIGQAKAAVWGHVDFKKEWLSLLKSKRTPARQIPMCPELIQLLNRLHSERSEVERGVDQPILRIKECLGFLKSGCKKTKIEKMTHHDLRHLFATTAMEQGIDVPTVSQLLGHSDGGALAMRVYGHRRKGHMTAEVKKLNFGLKTDKIGP